MQNRYVGDIGDFGKYGLLRAIFKNSDLRLGINWCFFPDESGTNDGKHISYLLDEKKNHEIFRECDRELYDRLKDIVRPKRINENEVKSYGRRSIIAVEKGSILPVDFHSKRKEVDWDVVFFDPDNGLEIKSCGELCKKAKKYVFYKELEKYYKAGKSLIIYQHRTRENSEKYGDRIKGIVSKDHIHNVSLNDLIVLRFKRVSVRDYIFVPQPAHKEEFKKKVEDFLKSSWREHFELVNMLD
jgi:hypothetical protein